MRRPCSGRISWRSVSQHSQVVAELGAARSDHASHDPSAQQLRKSWTAPAWLLLRSFPSECLPELIHDPVVHLRTPDGQTEPKAIYWHRELPPVDAQPIGERVVEASSSHVPDTIAHRDELWNRCEGDLMAKARERLSEEIARLDDRYAHVLEESIETRHNACTGEAWLHRRFTYMLYR